MDDVLFCDVCNKEITDYDLLYHFSGMFNNTFSNHIHVCPDCYHFTNDDSTYMLFVIISLMMIYTELILTIE